MVLSGSARSLWIEIARIVDVTNENVVGLREEPVD